ncbi:MAG: hypothetical protein ACOC28_08035 [Alkalispirochaetaceae bacterium]
MTGTLRNHYLARMRRFKQIGVYLAPGLLVGILASCATFDESPRGAQRFVAEAPVVELEEPADLREILYVSGLGRSLATVGADGTPGSVLLESDGFPGFPRGVITAHSWSPDGEAVVAAATHAASGSSGWRMMRPVCCVFASPR